MASESEKGVKKQKRVTIVYNDWERKSSPEGNLDGRARQESGATIRKGTDGNGERERQTRQRQQKDGRAAMQHCQGGGDESPEHAIPSVGCRSRTRETPKR